MEDIQNEDGYTEDDDVQVEEEEEESKAENYDKDEETGNDMDNFQEGSSEEIEEQIEEASEELQREIIKEIHTREIIIRENVDRDAINTLNENIQSILAVLEAQNSKIESLQYQLAEQQEMQRHHVESDLVSQQPQNIEEHLGKLEGIVTSRVERMFTQHTQKESILVMNLYTTE